MGAATMISKPTLGPFLPEGFAQGKVPGVEFRWKGHVGAFTAPDEVPIGTTAAKIVNLLTLLMPRSCQGKCVGGRATSRLIRGC